MSTETIDNFRSGLYAFRCSDCGQHLRRRRNDSTRPCSNCGGHVVAHAPKPYRTDREAHRRSDDPAINAALARLQEAQADLDESLWERDDAICDARRAGASFHEISEVTRMSIGGLAYRIERHGTATA